MKSYLCAITISLNITGFAQCLAQSIDSPEGARSRTDRFIETEGTSSVEVTPDEMHISLGVKTFSPILLTAVSENDSRTKDVLTVAKN